MKSRILPVILLACSALCFAAAPEWILDTERSFPADEYIRAVGEGKTAESAKQYALAELSAYFSQTVESNVTARSVLRQDSIGTTREDSVRQEISNKTRTNLFSVQYTQTYFDKKGKRYFVCAYISRNEAWSILQPKLSALEAAILRNVARTQQETEPFKTICALMETQKDLDDFADLYAMALAVYPQKCNRFAESAERGAAAVQALSSLKACASISVQVEGDRSRRIQTKIESLLSQNGFTVTAGQGMYKLSATAVCAMQSANGIITYYPQLSLTVRGRSGTVASFAAQTGKLAAYNEETAERKAFFELEQALEERFINECFK